MPVGASGMSLVGIPTRPSHHSVATPVRVPLRLPVGVNPRQIALPDQGCGSPREGDEDSRVTPDRSGAHSSGTGSSSFARVT
jgi:hypothetical protein